MPALLTSYSIPSHMRIAHISDWHAFPRAKVPLCDLVVCTGDMAKDFVQLGDAGWRHNTTAQAKWIQSNKGIYRTVFEDPATPVLCLRGNHDGHSIAPLFGGKVYEPDGFAPQVFELLGLKFGCKRGVEPIGSLKFWWDETDTWDLNFRTQVDVLVTHDPPKDVLDRCPNGNVGSPSVLEFVMTGKPQLHLFGHIHESFGITRNETTVFSNAATGVQVLDLSV